MRKYIFVKTKKTWKWMIDSEQLLSYLYNYKVVNQNK